VAKIRQCRIYFKKVVLHCGMACCTAAWLAALRHGLLRCGMDLEEEPPEDEDSDEDTRSEEESD